MAGRSLPKILVLGSEVYKNAKSKENDLNLSYRQNRFQTEPLMKLNTIMVLYQKGIRDLAQNFLQDCICAQRRLSSACPSAQSDQSLRCPPVNALV